MLLKLHGRDLVALSGESSTAPFLGRICENSRLPEAARGSEIFLTHGGASELPSGFRACLVRSSKAAVQQPDAYALSPNFDYLAHGDVVRIDPQRGGIAVLYRRSSPFNSMLVTERCDNYCVMCSQPPKVRGDDWLVDELIDVIPLMAIDTPEVGITGGEPGLLGTRLVHLIERFERFLPRTALHVLSNGRAFANEDLPRAIARIGHHDLMFGIPLYGHLPELHDYIVQARGAYDETVRGILNLKRHRIRVELRFVIHKDTMESLPAFARFVARNLLFVDHVALMGLELMGFARSNLGAVWVDPLDYQDLLTKAVGILDTSGIRVSIYNHQLCVLAPVLHRFAVSSISDWKNRYFDECKSCDLKHQCGGFFASADVRRSRGIAPITAEGG